MKESFVIGLLNMGGDSEFSNKICVKGCKGTSAFYKDADSDGYGGEEIKISYKDMLSTKQDRNIKKT